VALVRENHETREATLLVRDEIGDARWEIAEKYALPLSLASVVDGDPQSGIDRDELRWLAVAGLESVPWLPSGQSPLEDVRLSLTDRLDQQRLL
jgi:hypothetical protein